MTEFAISEAAERVGFSPATLRYYEQIDLLRPARSPSGYRRYSVHDLELLRFIGRAKRLGISLDDIRDLVAGWRADDCGRTREQLASAITARLDAVEALIAELTAFRGQLQAVRDELRARQTSGRCGPGCGCEVEVTAVDPPAARALALVALVERGRCVRTSRAVIAPAHRRMRAASSLPRPLDIRVDLKV